MTFCRLRLYAIGFCILHEGQIVECGTPQSLFHLPQHAYTRRLVAPPPNPLARGGSNEIDAKKPVSRFLQRSSF
jgi:ABC-type dipeptide/oligopeptide/nickel transport system ATPase component